MINTDPFFRNHEPGGLVGVADLFALNVFVVLFSFVLVGKKGGYGVGDGVMIWFMRSNSNRYSVGFQALM